MVVRGDTPLFLLERTLAVTFPETESINTVAGLLMQRLGRMPETGTIVDLGTYSAKVMSVRGASVETVHIVRVTEPAEQES